MAFSLKKLILSLIVLLFILFLLAIIGSNTFAKGPAPQGSLGDTFYGSCLIIGVVLITLILLVLFMIGEEARARTPWWVPTRLVKWYAKRQVKSAFTWRNGAKALVGLLNFI